MVLSLASIANASIVLSPPLAETKLWVQTDPLDAPDKQQALFLAVGQGGALGPGEMIYLGSLSAIINNIDRLTMDPDLELAVDAAIGEKSTRIDFIELFDGTATPPPVVGHLVRYEVIPGDNPTNVYLLGVGNHEAVISRSVIIPEPMTIALLGLGGLLLRRHK